MSLDIDRPFVVDRDWSSPEDEREHSSMTLLLIDTVGAVGQLLANRPRPPPPLPPPLDAEEEEENCHDASLDDARLSTPPLDDDERESTDGARLRDRSRSLPPPGPRFRLEVSWLTLERLRLTTDADLLRAPRDDVPMGSLACRWPPPAADDVACGCSDDGDASVPSPSLLYREADSSLLYRDEDSPPTVALRSCPLSLDARDRRDDPERADLWESRDSDRSGGSVLPTATRRVEELRPLADADRLVDRSRRPSPAPPAAADLLTLPSRGAALLLLDLPLLLALLARAAAAAACSLPSPSLLFSSCFSRLPLDKSSSSSRATTARSLWSYTCFSFLSGSLMT